LIALVGCGGSGGGNTPPPNPALSQAKIDLAHRLCETQLINGTWDFQQPYTDPINYASTGFQNIWGLIEDGLLTVIEEDLADDGVIDDVPFAVPAAHAAKDYMIGVMLAFDGTLSTSVSVPNFSAMTRYHHVFGLQPNERALVYQTWSSLRDSRNVVPYNSDPTVKTDGLFNRIVAARAGIPGIIGWDCTFILKSALCMNEPQNEIDWLVSSLKGLKPMTVAGWTDLVPLAYGLDSCAHILEGLNLVGDSSENAGLVAAIETESNLDGSYADNPEAAYQTTAYILMAYREINHPLAAGIAQWLESRVFSETFNSQLHVGLMYDPISFIETYESSGEVLTALSAKKPASIQILSLANVQALSTGTYQGPPISSWEGAALVPSP
jgi:hypothetical protein